MQLTVFQVARWSGTPVNARPREHDELGWFAAADLPGLRLAHSGYLQPLGDALTAGPPEAARRPGAVAQARWGAGRA